MSSRLDRRVTFAVVNRAARGVSIQGRTQVAGMPTGEPFVYEQASERLIELVPQLEEVYRRELDWWGSERPGPHVVYEDILVPFINKLLASTGDESGATLRRVFEFVERLSTAADERLHDLVAVAICERLVADHLQMSRVQAYMGPATLRILERAKR